MSESRRRLRIALAVQGKFHSQDLARGLAELGHEVWLFCSYPSWQARVNVPPNCRVVTNWWHLCMRQFLMRSGLQRIAPNVSERLISKSFGTWAERRLAKQQWDVIYSWSSVSLELLKSTRVYAGLRLLARGSTHISYQDRILRDEAQRTNTRIERPLPATISRELLEYGLADRIVVLSQFCKQSFEQEGVPSEKVLLMPAGVETRKFAATSKLMSERVNRLSADMPLRVLTCGTFSLRKGAFDFGEVVKQLSSEKFEFRFVGSVSEDGAAIKDSLDGKAEFVGRVAQNRLIEHFAWGDLFLFLSLEEGLPQTLFQAAASGIPVIATENAAVSDVLSGGGVGWAVPARSVSEVVNLLRTVGRNRRLIEEKLLQFGQVGLRTWETAASILESQILCLQAKAI